MIRVAILALAIMLPDVAVAQDAGDGATATGDAVHGTAPLRVRSVTLAANETCPKSTSDEIVVCSTIEDPYRIPKQFRHLAPSAANRSWVDRAAVLDDIGRVNGATPGTCSPIGGAGQTGCTQQLLKQWAAEREQIRRDAGSVP